MDSSLESPRVGAQAPLRPTLLHIASSREVVQPALRTALVVGSVLNLINQGDALFGQAPLVIGKLLFTYCVPYCVSTYTAIRLLLRVSAGSDTRAATSARR